MTKLPSLWNIAGFLAVLGFVGPIGWLIIGNLLDYEHERIARLIVYGWTSLLPMFFGAWLYKQWCK